MSYNVSSTQGFGSITVSFSSTQTFTSNTEAVIQFDTTDLNYGTNAAGSALYTFDNANDRITVNQTGTYMIVGAIAFMDQTLPASQSSRCALFPRVNGTAVGEVSLLCINTSVAGVNCRIRPVVTTIVNLTSGDNVDITAITPTGGTSWTSSNTSYRRAYLALTQLAKG